MFCLNSNFNSMKIIAILIFLTMIVKIINAQEMSGIVNGNYAGVNSYAINPSMMADSKLYMDINVLTTGFFYQISTKRAFGNFRLNLPSIMINRGNHAFAFICAARTALSYKLNSANNGLYNEFIVAGAAWGEIGLSYSKTYKRHDKNWWAAGLTLKYLMGAGGSYYANTGISFTPQSSFSGNLSNAGFTGGGSMGYGKGAGLDIGLTYQKKDKSENIQPFTKLCQQKYRSYRYKVGISVVDLGFLKFSQKANNSEYNSYMGKVDSVLIHLNDSVSYYINSDSINHSNNSSQFKNTYYVFLPAGACFQLDYRINKHWFINGLVIKGLNLDERFIRRPTLIAVTPRYEKRWFEVNFPVGLSDMNFRMGASIRFWNFTIGTDRLFGMGQGFDVYASLKLNFQKGKCERKKGLLEPFRQLFK